MKITLLGTCAGTEPMPGRQHTSFVIQAGGGLYWFDAGEGCSRTAHLLGLPILSTRAIFISHPHIDHIGGLANLCWTIHKLNARSEKSKPMEGARIPLYIPDPEVGRNVLEVVRTTAENRNPAIVLRKYRAGVVFRDAALTVSAIPNRHMGPAQARGLQRSWSLAVVAGGRRLVYSGDVGSVEELRPLLRRCDMLFMETGHHAVEGICRFLKDSGCAPRRLVFVHHGRAILRDPSGELRRARRILGPRVTIGEDGMTFRL